VGAHVVVLLANAVSDPHATAATPRAPWYFRKRFSLFGAVYGVAIFFGYFFAGVAGLPLLPAFVTSGRPALFGALAIGFTAGGWLLRVWASSYLAGTVVWTQDVTGGDLRIAGPYRFTRNPLYLGNLLQAVGIGLLFPWTVVVLLAVLMLAYCLVLIGVEERFLAREHGERYARYRASVARLFPLPWKIAPDSGQRGSLREGLRSERMTAGFTVMAVVLVALRWPR
jgi:protein-S-isoprenylcysteine O-methyltransferase Ste14